MNRQRGASESCDKRRVRFLCLCYVTFFLFRLLRIVPLYCFVQIIFFKPSHDFTCFSRLYSFTSEFTFHTPASQNHFWSITSKTGAGKLQVNKIRPYRRLEY
jgi:hypothetical protein